MKVKCCIIIPFYGKWPDYFELFLAGLAKNHWFDVVFITDLVLPRSVPENALKIHLSKADFEDLIQIKLVLKVNLDNSYKLCDLKPSYGYLFNDFLNANGYDFWGFGDIDVIYGQISSFVQESDFHNYDVISFRKHWISGSLVFLRNNQTLLELFMSTDDYERVFSSNKFYAFDECGQNWNLILAGMDLRKMTLSPQNFTQLILKAADENLIKLKFEDYAKESIARTGYIKYENNRIFDPSQKEYAYFHYVLVKQRKWFVIPNQQKIPRMFFITKTGIHTEFNEIRIKGFLRILLSLPFELVRGIRRKLKSVIDN